MSDPQKTVFISYRRSASKYIARLIFTDLRQKGYDVFLDTETIDSGAFDTIILNQIAARAHFLVILTAGTLDRCSEPNDWLRTEIEHAIDLQRNVVPVLMDEFSFDEAAKKHLTGKLSNLTRLNGLKLHYDYFDEGMERLRSRYLKQPLYGAIQAVPLVEEKQIEQKIEETASEPAPTKEELTAEQFFAQAYTKYENGDLDGAIADYTRAISLNPHFAEAYINRGNVHADKGDLDAAIADYTHAIQLDPDHANAYYNRGLTYANKGETDAALADYTYAIQLNPNLASAYNNRGNVYFDKGVLAAAIADYTRAIQLDPSDAQTYSNRGVAYQHRSEFDAALADYNHAIQLQPDDAHAYGNRAEVYFELQHHDKALIDFEKADELRSDYSMTIGGLAITHHALGNINKAKRLWKSLVEKNQRYLDADWVQKELNWPDALVEEARKLIASLDS